LIGFLDAFKAIPAFLSHCAGLKPEIRFSVMAGLVPQHEAGMTGFGKKPPSLTRCEDFA
jgi:hypothetical protein